MSCTALSYKKAILDGVMSTEESDFGAIQGTYWVNKQMSRVTFICCRFLSVIFIIVILEYFIRLDKGDTLGNSGKVVES